MLSFLLPTLLSIPLIFAQEIYISGPFQMCQLQLEQYAVVLNSTAYKDARAACESFNMDLLDVSRFFPVDIKPDDPNRPVMSTVGTMLLDCAIFGGVQITAGWVSSRDARGKPAGGMEANCFAVDFTGTIVSGSFSSCQDGHLYPVCKKRQGHKVRGVLAREKQRMPQIPVNIANASVDVPPNRPDLAAAQVQYSPPACSASAPQPTCAFGVLGYKVITQPLTYSDAECACRAMGMSLADTSFISFWPSALLTHHCAGTTMNASLAWLNSEPDLKLNRPPSPSPANGCLAMRAAKLRLMDPRIEPQPCSRLLPAVCQGPVLAGWDELAPLLAMAGFEGVTEALNSIYPLPRLPSLSDVARLTPLKSAGLGMCRSANLEIVRVAPGESAADACAKVGLAMVAVDSHRDTVDRMVKTCGLVGPEGVRVTAPDGVSCAFVDRMGSLYLSITPLATSLYPPCSRPTAVLCG